ADALFVMVIGGGFDQKIYGYGNREVDNEMSFTEIVDIFSANNPKSDADSYEVMRKIIGDDKWAKRNAND
ncbi:unnamed protein product, partial [Oppiella nova]